MAQLRAWRDEGTQHGLSIPDANMVAQVRASGRARGIARPILLTLDAGGTLDAMRRRGVLALAFRTYAVNPPRPPRPQINPPGRPAGTGATDKKQTALVGDPVEPVQESGPSAAGDAKFQGAALAFRGVNFILQKINGSIQARRFNEAWSRLQPEVQRRLDEDPALGALLLVYYQQGPADNDSVIEPVTVFRSMNVAYGVTEDEALRTYASQARIGVGGNIGDRIWLKPKAPLDVSRLRLPFGTTVAGLATFVPGKEKLVRVEFKGRAGFDDRMFSREVLDVPSRMTPRFYFLWPPDHVSYYQDSGIRKVDISWDYSKDADVTNGELDRGWRGVPVVSLDSWINPNTWIGNGAVAAMVWPADNATANLFGGAAATKDNLSLLSGQGIEFLRWVRPEFIRVIEQPFN